MMQHKQKDYRKARKSLERVMTLDPRHKLALSALGLACTAMGDIEEGIRHYTAARKLDESNKDVWVNMFQCYKESGQVRSRTWSCVHHASYLLKPCKVVVRQRQAVLNESACISLNAYNANVSQVSSLCEGSRIARR
jgi:tetratricopeptide (TPR) repeat protein